MKITEKLLSRDKQGEEGAVTFSFEYFVPKTAQGIQNLYDRMDRMYQNALPLFVDVTWNAGGAVTTVADTLGGKKKQLTNDIVFTAQSVLGLETCMHLTCTNMSAAAIDDALQQAYDSGCQNILALRGDPPILSNGKPLQSQSCDFQYAKDLVKYIRQKYGDYFDIGVAAYPEGDSETGDAKALLPFLKEKIDCGANFIITQMFYDADNFIDWCKQLREIGIDIPILPGIMPITTYSSFIRRCSWCNVSIPEQFLSALDPVKENDELVREVGNNLLMDMCRKIIDSKYVSHLHVYTMNLEKPPLALLDNLKLLPDFLHSNSTAYNTMVILPWRKSLNPKRRNEEIRPIFWAKRPYSYVARTSNWAEDEFPNGRFGDSSSPAFGDLDLCGSSLIRQSPEKSLRLWGKPQSISDIAYLVTEYLVGNLKCLPWSDVPINHGEARLILPQLIQLNQDCNFITINSQPALNGARSNLKDLGWGPPDGYVYQKQYLEFLLPSEKLPSLEMALSQYNDDLTFFAIGSSSELHTNHPDGSKANAVTWGIFPGREVIQPTIVEKVSFLAWKEEFYQILQDWEQTITLQSDKDDKTAVQSALLLQHIIDNYLLVNVVDNDYISNDNRIFSILHNI